MLTLACGPYLPAPDAKTLVALLAIKPVIYFAFIQAFRYRVCAQVPMSFRRAATLTAIRTAAGFVLVIAAGAVIALLANVVDVHGAEIFAAVAGWGFLLAERLAVWGVLGSIGASIRGRRLVGWTISGGAIDLGYDVLLVVMTIGAAVWLQLVIGGLFLMLLVPLHIIGRRQGLRARFWNHPFCKKCQYNLTGNLSGFCPECGTPVQESVVSV